MRLTNTTYSIQLHSIALHPVRVKRMNEFGWEWNDFCTILWTNFQLFHFSILLTRTPCSCHSQVLSIKIFTIAISQFHLTPFTSTCNFAQNFYYIPNTFKFFQPNAAHWFLILSLFADMRLRYNTRPLKKLRYVLDLTYKRMKQDQQ